MKGGKSPLLPDYVAGISQRKWTVKTRKEAKGRLKEGKSTFIREHYEMSPTNPPVRLKG